MSTFKLGDRFVYTSPGHVDYAGVVRHTRRFSNNDVQEGYVPAYLDRPLYGELEWHLESHYLTWEIKHDSFNQQVADYCRQELGRAS